MNKQIIDNLLEALDSSANSNTFWIELDIASDETDVSKNLQKHLELGNFHHEVVKADIERGWYIFSEIVMPKDFDHTVLIQRPGNVWNDNSDLTLHSIDKDMIRILLLDLLTKSGKYFSPSALGISIEQETADKLINELSISLDRASESWTAYKIDPKFLHFVNRKYNEGFGQLGYFENHGRDLALCFQVGNSLQILLVNGFS